MKKSAYVSTVVYASKGKKRPFMRRSPLKRTQPTTPAKKKRIKPSSASKLKKELEALQKQLVIQTYGKDCFTCEAKDLEGKNCHLGHVPWPRTDLSTQAKFSIEYTRIQCMVCNIHKGGAGAKAWVRMSAQGIDMDLLRETSDKERGKPVPKSWFEAKIAEYKLAIHTPPLVSNAPMVS